MPDKAHKGSDCTIADLHRNFYCIVEGCPAVMSLVSATSKKDAYFRTLPTSPKHISVNCVRCSLIFDSSKYDESKFDRNSAFDWMFTTPAAK